MWVLMTGRVIKEGEEIASDSCKKYHIHSSVAVEAPLREQTGAPSPTNPPLLSLAACPKPREPPQPHGTQRWSQMTPHQHIFTTSNPLPSWKMCRKASVGLGEAVLNHFFLYIV